MNTLIIKGPTKSELHIKYFNAAYACVELTLQKCRSQKKKIAALSMFHLKYPEFFSAKLTTTIQRYKDWGYPFLPESWFRKCCDPKVLLQIVMETRSYNEK